MRKFAIAGMAFGYLSLVAPSAPAQEQALVPFNSMTPEVAMKLARAALEACRKENAQVAVAVVDRSGVLQALIRDRFAGPHTPETARRKAWTAISFRSDTLSLSEATKPGTASYGANFVGDALMLGGGVPVEAKGSIVGGVGVSGAPRSSMDDACGRAGIEAVAADLSF